MAIEDFEGLLPQEFPFDDLRIHSSSRHRQVKLFAGEEGDFLGSPAYPAISPTELDKFHVVHAGEVGRLDIISFLHYETYRWWWVIAIVNDLANPLTEMFAGQVLRVPERGRIVTILERSVR